MNNTEYVADKILGLLGKLGKDQRLSVLERVVRGTPKAGKLVVGVCAYWTLPYNFLGSLAGMLNDLSEADYDVDIVIVSEPYIDMARNTIVERAYQKKADWILFLDQDMVFPPDTARRLIAHDVPVVGGIYFQKMAPHHPLLYDWVTDQPGFGEWTIRPRLDYEEGLVKCGAVGMGCTLISLKAIDKVIDYQLNGPLKEQFGESAQPFKIAVAKVGEDIWFARFCDWAGVPIYCDTKLKLQHVGLMEIGETHFRMASRYDSLESALEVLEDREMRALTGGDPVYGFAEVADG